MHSSHSNHPYTSAPISVTPPSSNGVTARTTRRLWGLKLRIFLLTFVSYAVYSGTRTPFGITKSALHPEDDKKSPSDHGYAPFDSEDWGSTYLGICDTVFLSFYAIGLFITGPLGDRLNLRWFIGSGMLLSGSMTFMFGAAALMGIHNLAWFIACNLLAGLFQATGWPGNVTLLSRWFGEGNRGSIMGVWNAHGSIGNISFKFFATFLMHQYGWQWAFMGCGLLCMAIGLIESILIIPHPHDTLSQAELAELKRINGGEAKVTEASPDHILSSTVADNDEHHHASSNFNPTLPSPGNVQESVDASPFSEKHHDDHPNIPFSQALRVPGVLEYSCCLFFSKLVVYAFQFWLPFYLSNLNYTDTQAGNLSTLFDIGGVAGGIIAGWASDRSGKSGVVSFVMLLLCLPGLYVYQAIAGYGIVGNVLLMFLVGVLVNGPYTLISSAVAADLGSHPSLMGNPKAMSTVTGIIDGSGSVGAALQGVIIGVLGKKMGWTNVFYMLMSFCLIAAATLFRIVRKESRFINRCCRLISRSSSPSSSSSSSPDTPRIGAMDSDDHVYVSEDEAPVPIRSFHSPLPIHHPPPPRTQPAGAVNDSSASLSVDDESESPLINNPSPDEDDEWMRPQKRTQRGTKDDRAGPLTTSLLHQ